MIICKPNQSVVFLIVVSLLIGYSLVFIWLYQLFTSKTASIGFLVLACVVFTVLLYLSIRLAVSYVQIRGDAGKIHIHYRFVGRTHSYSIKELTDIQEVKIKTFGKSEFKQLILRFPQEQVSINNQVYSQYDALKSYIGQKRVHKKK